MRWMIAVVLACALTVVTNPPRALADLPQRVQAAEDYLARRPGTVGYVLRDRVTGRAYRNDAAGTMIWTASTIKLAMVVDLLSRSTAGQITMSQSDRALMVDMLHSSDNDAADALWSRFGGPDHMAFNRNFPAYGMTDVRPQLGFGDTYPYWGLQKTTTDDLDRLMNYVLTGCQRPRPRRS